MREFSEIMKAENRTAANTFFNLLPSPQMLTGEAPDNMTFCGRVNVMGTIVQDSAPYLFPLIIEYSLIGAAVIYIMWRHIGRQPRWATVHFFPLPFGNFNIAESSNSKRIGYKFESLKGGKSFNLVVDCCVLIVVVR